MRIPRPTHSVIVAYLALFVATSGTAVAANGSAFTLGGANKETRTATLTNTTGPTVGFVSPAGKPPFTVRRTVKVPGLNADRLDGLSSGAFMRSGAQAADADRLDGLDSSALQRTLQVKAVEAPLSSGFTSAARCPAGWTATGGGYYLHYNSDPATRDWVERSAPSSYSLVRPDAWSVWIENPGGSDGGTVYAVCVK